MSGRRLLVVRFFSVLVVATGLSYLGWRWSTTVTWTHWWIAVPLVLAETFSMIEVTLSAVMMWHARRRPPPPPARPGRTVDVFITTVDEPLSLVLKTAIAARDMTYPHRTWILDDGRRPDFEQAAGLIGVGYLARGADWDGLPRFAKAGNVNDALSRTSGELIAILDADQVPEPRFLDRVLGYFDDEDVAFVQTPQHYWNVPPGDPLASQAQMFYGLIQQGKDGWNASFFCGSNAVLRREALMAVGLTRYAREAAERTHVAVRAGHSRLVALSDEVAGTDPAGVPVVEEALGALVHADRRLRAGEMLSEVTYELRTAFRHAAHGHPRVARELDAVAAAVDVARTDQALAVHPLDTSTITEDMATAMHLHAMGWTSAFHHEVLVHGLAPEDLKTMIAQRRRWAAGTMQIFFADNPLLVRGLTVAQRLMYLSTTLSYLAGFATLVYLAGPIVFLLFGVFPVVGDPLVFIALFTPFFVCAQVLFTVAGRGTTGRWRARQVSFALFPTWIGATFSAASATFLGRHLTFTVTAKFRQSDGRGYRLVLPQLVVMALLVVASGVGIVRAVEDGRYIPATVLTLVWVVLDLCLLSVVVGAARYPGPGDTVRDPLPAPAELPAVLRRIATSSPTRAMAVLPIHRPELRRPRRTAPWPTDPRSRSAISSSRGG